MKRLEPLSCVCSEHQATTSTFSPTHNQCKTTILPFYTLSFLQIKQTICNVLISEPASWWIAVVTSWAPYAKKILPAAGSSFIFTIMSREERYWPFDLTLQKKKKKKSNVSFLSKTKGKRFWHQLPRQSLHSVEAFGSAVVSTFSLERLWSHLLVFEEKSALNGKRKWKADSVSPYTPSFISLSSEDLFTVLWRRKLNNGEFISNLTFSPHIKPQRLDNWTRSSVYEGSWKRPWHPLKGLDSGDVATLILQGL